LTGFYLFSIAGGHFGPELKKAGLDVLIVKGRAATPTYLFISNDRVDFMNAEAIWGMPTDYTQDFIKSQLKDKSMRITCIGPAGENLVPYAGLINEKRAAGRGGGGAVMGSKNLKAIAVKGVEQTKLFDAGGFNEAVKNANQEVLENAVLKTFSTYGSASMVEVMSESGILPTRNWQMVRSAAVEKITSRFIRENYVVKDLACAGPCPVRCSKLTLVRDGVLAGQLSEGPEYETIYAFGSCCGIYDAPTIIAADAFCDRYGLDTISAGVSIAFAMECFEKSIISEEVTGGVRLKFGDSSIIMPLLHQIVYRTGFGDAVALGTKKMAEKFGGGSAEFAMQVKGMELGAYDPRGAKGMAAVFAFGPRGGCHHAGGFTVLAEVMSGKYDRFAEDGKAKLAIVTRNRRSAAHDSGGLCAFVGVGASDDTTVKMLTAATGLELVPADIYTIGERIACVERAFSVREGLVPTLDTLPRRLLEESASDGPNKGHRVDLSILKRQFYEEAEWDEITGLPKKEKLLKLGLDWVLKD
jgi:aldehyde:ferredoxin oxidoreductase